MIKTLNKFLVKDARYYLDDGNGSSVIMKVDYAGNKYSIEVVLNGENIEKIVSEGELIAEHLLNDKARVNLADRLKAKVK